MGYFKKILRLNTPLFTVSIVSLLLGFNLRTNPVYITGHLKPNPSDSSAFVAKISVFVKGGSKILAKTLTDNKGNFGITFLTNNEKSFDFFCFGVGVDTILIGSFQKFESDTPEITFYLPALQKKNASGKVLCPKCKKADKVYKIIYGDGIPGHFDDEPENNDPKARIVNGQYHKGISITGIANFYCDRDKVEY